MEAYLLVMDGVDTQGTLHLVEQELEQTKIIDLFIKKKDGDCTLLVRHTVRTGIDVFNFLLDYACRALWLIHWYTDDLDASTLLIQCRVFSAENFVTRVGILQYYQEVPTRRLCCFVRCEF